MLQLLVGNAGRGKGTTNNVDLGQAERSNLPNVQSMEAHKYIHQKEVISLLLTLIIYTCRMTTNESLNVGNML